MKSNTYKKIAMASFALAIAAGSTSLAHAATGDIINTTNKKIYAVSSSETIKALIADLKDAGGDVFLIEDASGKYFDSNAKLTAQSAEVAKYLLAGNVSLTDPTAIKTYVTANAASITAAVKVATDKVATSTVDITTYTPPVIVTTDAEKAAAVDTTIAALPAVADLKLTDSAAVTAAKTAYTALTDTQKALVTKLDTLTAVEAQIKVLTEAAALPVVSSVSAINATAATGDSYTLPTTVKATLSDGTTKDIAVTWDKVASATVAGSFTFTGTLAATSGVVNTNNVTVSATLTVTSAIKSELAKVTNAVVTTVPFGTANTQVGVEAAMLVLANHAVDTGYTVSIQADSTYSPTLKVWTGKFIVTNNTNLAVTTDVAARSITVATSASAAGAIAQLALVTPAVVTTVPFGTANTQVAVEAAILKLANAAVDPAYTVTIADGSTYSTASKSWIGKLIVTNNTTAENTTTDAGYRTITVATAADAAGSATELAKITNAEVTTVPNGTANTQIAVEAAMTTLAQAAVDPTYHVAIAAGSTYSTESKSWTGKFTVNNIATPANTTTDATYRTITVATAASSAGAIAQLALVTPAVVTTVPFGTANTQVAVEAAILKLANAAVDPAYTVTIADGSTYSTASKTWIGKLIVTNNTTAANTTTDAGYRTVVVATGVSTAGSTTELAKITNAVVTTVPSGTLNTKIAVEAAIVNLANAAVDPAYTVTIADGSSYSTTSKLWTGKLTVTNIITGANTTTDATYRTITVATAASAAGSVIELAKVTNAVVTTLPSGTANTQVAVEAAILKLANAAVDQAYTVTIAEGSTYSTASKSWTGKLIVTNNTTAANATTDAYRTITVVNAASTAGATAELAKVTNAAITTVPFGTNTTGAGAQAAVETAITTLAQAKVGSGYTVTIAAGSTYSTVSKVWTGKLIVTNDVTNTNTITDATYRSITVAVAVDVTGATAQLANVTNAVVTTVPSGTANTQADVESAMLALANAAVDPAYVVTIAPGSTYTPASKAWSGEFTVTNIANPEITKTDAAYRVIVVATQAPSTIVFGSGATVAKLATDSAFTNAASGIGAGTITYSSATPATATVNPTTGEVTIFAPGTTVITATRAATTANTAVTATYTVNVSAALIAPSTILVATPAVDGTPATTIAAGTGYTGTISWTTPATGNFVAATPAATVVLTADANHTFTGIAATGAITIAGSTSATYVVSGAGHILTITVGYAAIS
ncbi:Ig-like domain-containing protein [Clostridium sp. DSM 17811]|uniref:beta strand repeat-containing protein n=1 Tax=Clostridium sp. DSM 17811 TaxID=2843317 RepID=UPI001C0C5503|nr:Ig-like domain-containing protein [Clostridium sp. DSM 17811]MBU3097683.1 Ig-like domain-containing protein [Clostridium sp. DSM 17811]